MGTAQLVHAYNSLTSPGWCNDCKGKGQCSFSCAPSQKVSIKNRPGAPCCDRRIVIKGYAIRRTKKTANPTFMDEWQTGKRVVAYFWRESGIPNGDRCIVIKEIQKEGRCTWYNAVTNKKGEVWNDRLINNNNNNAGAFSFSLTIFSKVTYRWW